ncbi:cytochrome c-type biogenesis protein [Phenylobacterium immobile]|uniref:cytochrome c-type biogenesis protein n=1 Tax=Phenylobacterium immobile TaxID=21 RepID=UPI000AEB34F0|nr:cytochrome c-type biogenesis protein [Phenylobacterium immobile]
MRLKLLAAAVLGALCLAAASDPAERLADPVQEARARALFAGVRCLVCQNESIDDSDAELAADLRRIVRQQVAAGRTDAEIKAFLTDRYGEFVLMRPAFGPANLALWIGPFLVVGLGVLLWRRRVAARPEEAALTEEELQRLKALSVERKA